MLNREPPPAKPLLHPVNTPTPASGSGIGPERALEAIHKKPARSAKADRPPSFPASAGSIPQSPPTAPRPIRDLSLMVDQSPLHLPLMASHLIEAAAGSVRSEHWKRSTKNLRAAQKPILPPELTCERRIDPAEPPTASRPIARTTAQNPTKNPETYQRTRTQRLKASHPSHTTHPAGGSGTDPERALEAIHKKTCAQRNG